MFSLITTYSNQIKLLLSIIITSLIFIFYYENKIEKIKNEELINYNIHLNEVIEKSNIQSEKDKKLVESLNFKISQLSSINNKRQNELNSSLNSNSSISSCYLSESELSILNNTIKNKKE